MESLPEDEELSEPMAGIAITFDGKADSSDNDTAQMFLFEGIEEEPSPAHSVNRLSWQSTASAKSAATIDPAEYLAELDTDLTLPKSPTVASNFPRGSTTSLASFMTGTSIVDSNFPSSPRSGPRRSLSPDSREAPILSDGESLLSETEDNLLDSFFDGQSCVPL